jgi:dTDP-4-amino-4,6-dideoxygalactose transaminase
VESHRPTLDITKVEAVITAKTKAIIPVHMNGRSVDMIGLKLLAKKHQLFIIEDAAQAFSSKNSAGFLGTQSDVGCFSLSMAKIMATGQGGFAVTNDADLAHKLRAIRTHGVENVKDPQQWQMVGFNFRYTDIQAAIGIEQLKKIPNRKTHLIDIYQAYEEGLKKSPLTLIPVDIDQGEVPIYAEFLAQNRGAWIDSLSEQNIETRPFYPCINKADYFDYFDVNFPNAQLYGDQGIYLPSGPAQKLANIYDVISCISKIQEGAK